MKKNQAIIIAIAILSISLFAACSKNVSSDSSKESNVLQADELDGFAPKDTLVLKPGPDAGDDSYTNYDLDNPSDTNANQNNVPELTAGAWTQNGLPLTTRIYIKFDNLTKVPTTAKVVKATLQLFGLNGSSLSTPQGNSVYPGSPYVSAGYTDNSLLVQRVLSTWKESTLTWANEPNVATPFEAIIPSSTAQWDYNPKVDVTALVKRMVTKPETNFGFRISLVNETAYRSVVFASSESAIPALRPQLTVIYK